MQQVTSGLDYKIMEMANRIRELRDEGKCLVIVSHDLDMVARFTDRGIVLDKGRIIHDGPIGDAVALLRRRAEG